MDKRTNQAFLALLRAGLWEQSVALAPFAPVDFDAIFNLAEEQSVTGLVAAGLGHISDTKVEKMQARPFLKKVIALEQRNASMNDFIGWLVARLREENVTSVLIKGQGIAQCYERPDWRAAGDIDLLLDAENYEKAKSALIPLASKVESEVTEAKHQGMSLGGFEVELHGTFTFVLSKRVDRVIDEVQEKVCSRRAVREWQPSADDFPILLPAPDEDMIIIFTHFLRHFYTGGIGLRQICDWCRLLWTYRSEIDRDLLSERLKSCGLMDEWQAFGAYAVEWLGLPAEAMPLYSSSRKWSRKAARLQSFIMKVGNFGHSRDLSYYSKYPYLLRKLISFGLRIGDGFSHMRIFPLDSIKFTWNTIRFGMKTVVRGE